ncbi:MAG: hypothetical protein U0103_10610 [Candidatus Obscuribacterales bacterium]|nr:hypothetical protein [Cyanobacteria bacterium SZAS LIN-5]
MSKHTSQSDFQRISLKELQCIVKPQPKEVDFVESYNKFISNTLTHLRTLLTIRTANQPQVMVLDGSDD